MAGKMTDSTVNQWDQRTIKAYSEGVLARYAAAVPTNPHTSGTPEYTAWAAGVTDAETGATAIDPCVAIPDGNIAS
jgi:hypothetical protein